MKIGPLHLDTNIWLAPMAGISNHPYRLIMKAQGAGLVFTEMVSANGLVHAGRRTRELLASSPEERPLGIQLFGDSPEVMAEAVRLIEADGELIDINAGCPVKKVIRSGAGSALLRSPATIGRIIAAMRRVTDKPLTVKIRSGWDRETINFIETARIAEAEGADAITLHPRTRCQGFSGQADWDHIRQIKAAVNIPVIGSGDIFCAEDALAMLQQTGCDGIMIGRGGYGNPWLIRDIRARLLGLPLPPPPSIEERCAMAEQHLEFYLDHYGPHKTLLDMRKHLCWYSRGLENAAIFRTAVNQAQTLHELRALIRDFFMTPTPSAKVDCHECHP